MINQQQNFRQNKNKDWFGSHAKGSSLIMLKFSTIITFLTNLFTTDIWIFNNTNRNYEFIVPYTELARTKFMENPGLIFWLHLEFTLTLSVSKDSVNMRQNKPKLNPVWIPSQPYVPFTCISIKYFIFS